MALATALTPGVAAAAIPSTPIIELVGALAPTPPATSPVVGTKLQVRLDPSAVNPAYDTVTYYLLSHPGTTTPVAQSSNAADGFLVTIPLSGSPVNAFDGENLEVLAKGTINGVDSLVDGSLSKPFMTDLATHVRFSAPPSPVDRTLSNATSFAYVVTFDPDAVCVRWRVRASTSSGGTWLPDPPGCLTTATANTAQSNAFGFSASASVDPGARTSTLTFGGNEGSWIVDAYAQDRLGNEATSSYRLTIDRTPPPLQLFTGPTEGQSITRNFTGWGIVTDADATIKCAVDLPLAASFGCSGLHSHSVGGLTDGPHTLIVRATDPAGNFTEQTVNFFVALPAGTDSTTPPEGFPTSTIPTPTPSTPRVRARISLKTTRGKGRRPTRKPYLTVTKTNKYASAIVVTCTAPRGARHVCPYRSRRFKVGDGKRIIAKRWKNRRLAKGTIVTIRVTGAGAIGRTVRYTVRTGRLSPKRRVYCTMPASTKLRTKC